MIVTIIGVGLIGGSLALALRETSFATDYIGIDYNEDNCKKAVELGLVDKCMSLEEAIPLSDLVIVAIPVDAARRILSNVLNLIKPDAVVVDMGSSKAGLCASVEKNKNRSQFVASHPIAGTENTGPDAAVAGLFKEKIAIICEKEKSDEQALALVQYLYKQIQMEICYMNPLNHDMEIAYVSHLSHISSFALGKTVLEIEKNEKTIFNMAGSGFASTVRLAKSSAEMWAPIFEQNSQYLVTALDAYIENLQEFRQAIAYNDTHRTKKLMKEANGIRKILDGEFTQRFQTSTVPEGNS